jgi:signal transduction histidine kinase
MHATYVPDIDDDGRVVGHFAITIDMTDNKRVQDALRIAKSQAEQANHSKSRFLAAASHDLRQPIQGMRLLIQTLQNAEAKDRRDETIHRLDSALKVTSNLLDTLLDISKLDAGIVIPEIEDVCAIELMQDLATRFDPEAEASGVTFKIVPCEMTLRTDPILMQRIVGNFLSNAMKFSDGRKVLLGARRKGNCLNIEVWDQGPGIPVGERSSIFEEFYQFGSQPTQSNKGLGLGLAIAARLSNLLEHEISLRSTPGSGSMFAIKVPISATPTPAVSASTPARPFHG